MAAMEVILEAMEGQAPTADTFVSMRIGDVQKQSRFSSSRTYRFPDPGDGRSGFGRIEVFKRIGHLTVSFDNLEGELQDVEVPCDAKSNLRMRLGVKGVEPAKELPSPEKKGRTRMRLDAAQKYLQEHKLEEVLAEAMREVIAAKPKDPHTFLSDQILKHRAKVPEDDEPLKAEKGAPPPLPEKAAPIFTDFAQYYSANMAPGVNGAFASLYTAFPQAQRPSVPAAAPKPAAPKAEKPSEAVAAQEPATLEKAVPEAQAQAAPKPAAESAEPGAMSVKELRKQLRAKLTEACCSGELRIALDAWDKAHAPPADAAAPTAAFAMRPSVGTWLAKAPEQVGSALAKVAPVPVAAAVAPAAAPSAAAEESLDLRKKVGAVLCTSLTNGSLEEALQKEASSRQASKAVPEEKSQPLHVKNVRAYMGQEAFAQLYSQFKPKAADVAAVAVAAPEEMPKPLHVQSMDVNMGQEAFARLHSQFTPKAAKAAVAAPEEQPKPLHIQNVNVYMGQEAFARLYSQFPPKSPEAAAPEPAPAAASSSPAAAEAAPVLPAVAREFVLEDLDAPAAAHIVELQNIIAEKDQELDRLKARMKKYGVAEHSRPVTPAHTLNEQAIQSLLKECPIEPVESMLKAMPTSPTARELLRSISEQAEPLHVTNTSLCIGQGDMFGSLYAKFERVAPKAMPAVEEAPAPVAAAPEAPAPAAAAAPVESSGSFEFKPSVGSWLARPTSQKPTPPPVASREFLDGAKERARKALEFALLADEAEEEVAEKAAPAAPAAPAEEATKAMQALWLLAPSVGTWLAVAPQGAEAPLMQVVGRRKSSLKKLKNEDIIRSFKAEISRRDQEIRDLKIKLGLL